MAGTLTVRLGGVAYTIEEWTTLAGSLRPAEQAWGFFEPFDVRAWYYPDEACYEVVILNGRLDLYRGTVALDGLVIEWPDGTSDAVPLTSLVDGTGALVRHGRLALSVDGRLQLWMIGDAIVPWKDPAVTAILDAPIEPAPIPSYSGTTGNSNAQWGDDPLSASALCAGRDHWDVWAPRIVTEFLRPAFFYSADGVPYRQASYPLAIIDLWHGFYESKWGSTETFGRPSQKKKDPEPERADYSNLDWQHPFWIEQSLAFWCCYGSQAALWAARSQLEALSGWAGIKYPTDWMYHPRQLGWCLRMFTCAVHMGIDTYLDYKQVVLNLLGTFQLSRGNFPPMGSVWPSLSPPDAKHIADQPWLSTWGVAVLADALCRLRDRGYDWILPEEFDLRDMHGICMAAIEQGRTTWSVAYDIEPEPGIFAEDVAPYTMTRKLGPQPYNADMVYLTPILCAALMGGARYFSRWRPRWHADVQAIVPRAYKEGWIKDKNAESVRYCGLSALSLALS